MLSSNTSDRIDLLTDAAYAWVADGVISRFASKQILIAVPSCVIVPISWGPIGELFAQMALFRCPDFDALVAASDELWREAPEYRAHR